MGYHPSRRVVISAAVILTFVAAFIVILPEAARRLAIHRLQSALTVPVAIEDVDINLFTGRAAVKNLIIGAREPRPILSVPLVSVVFSRVAVLTGNIQLQRIFIGDPRLVIERVGRAKYNFLQSVRGRQKTDESQAGGFTFAIQQLQIDGGEIVFIDHTQRPDYRVTFTSVDLIAGPISSLPGEVTATKFTAGVKIADGVVQVSGSSNLFGDISETEMTAKIANVKLDQFNTYLPYGGRLNLEKSSLSGEARYVLSYNRGKVTKNDLNASLTVAGSVQLAATQESRPIATLSGLTARDISLNLLRTQAQIGALIVDKPYLMVRRDSAGLNLQQFMPEREAPAENADRKKDGGGQMPLVIKKAKVKDGTVEFIDETISPAAKTAIQSVAAGADDVMLSPDFAAWRITAEGKLANGSLRLEGDVDGAPIQGKVFLTGKSLPFEPFRGYLDQLFTAAKSSGDYLNGQLQFAFGSESQGDIVTSITGKLEGRNMVLRFPEAGDPVLTTDRLGVDLKTIRIDENVRFDIARIAFVGANLRVLRAKDGSLDVTRLWKSGEEQAARANQRQGNQGKTTVAIHSIAVNESAIAIIDRSVSPNYTTAVSSVNGKLANLLPAAKRTEFKLDGRLGDDAKLSLTGWFTPFTEKPYLQLHATIRSYALPPLNPYATQYISHRIRQGQITTEIDYALKGDELQATAGVVLRNLKVGEKTGDEFAQRIGIPLELAVALLQDINGVIRLQLAMNSEEGPHLNVANLIWAAVRHAVVRAITAPFRLIGNVLTLGGRIGGLQIEPVLFEPGSEEMRQESREHLEQLADLLKEKPKLELKLNGNAAQDDVDVLKKNKFWEKIETAKGRNYEEALIQVYRQLGGITRPRAPLAPRAEESLEKFVMEHLDINDEELRKLARDRALVVEKELRERGIDPLRLLANAAENPLITETPSVQIEIAS
jgi:hypothetical protein